MNHKEYDKALSCFLKFQYSKEAVYYTVGCYEALGDAENQATFLEKLRSLQEETV